MICKERDPEATIELQGTEDNGKCGTYVDCLHDVKANKLIYIIMDEALKPSFEILGDMNIKKSNI